MKRITTVSILMLALFVVPLAAIAPANAAPTTTNSDIWFVLVFQKGSGSVDNFTATTAHTEANVTWSLMRSPQTAGTVQIGTANSRMVSDFNNVTNTGQATFQMTLNLTDTNSTRNPYGVGTINVTATVNVTRIGNSTYGVLHVPADGVGSLFSTSGTGAFSQAKLYGNLVIAPLFVGPLSPNGYTEALFFGTHARVGGPGVLIYNYPLLAASAFTDVTVLRGWTWWFFVQSDGGVGALTYQWYEGSALLPGQTDMVLSVSKSVAGTYSYTCRVSDNYGDVVTTNTIRLTVIG